MPTLKSLFRRNRELDVLLLEADHAIAWLAGGHAAPSTPPCTFALPEVQGKLREIADLVGHSRRPLRLALGSGWAATTTLDLPAMPRKELALVLTRRAAKLVGTEPGDVQFAARALGEMSHPDQDTQEQRYLLAACSRARIEPLRKEFARRGRRVACVMPARFARLSYASDRLSTDAGFAEHRSAIVIDVEAHCVVTSLISAGMLLSQAILEGDLESVPTLPLNVLQELKNLEAFHRKVRRGEGVSSVFVIGMTGLRAKLFESTVRALMDGVAVIFESCSDDGQHLRSISIKAAAHDGPFSVDLRAPIPLGQGERSVLAVGATIAVVGLSAVVVDSFEGQELRVQAASTRAQLESLDLRSLDNSDRAFEASVVSLENEQARLLALSRIGFDPAAELARIGACIPQDVLPWTFSLTAPELQGEVHLSGRVAPDPVHAFRSLERLRKGLANLPELEQVAVEPDGVLQRLGDHEQSGLAFDLHAKLVRPSP